MNEDPWGTYQSLTASPLGTQRAPSWSSRHPVLAALLCVGSIFLAAYAWRLSCDYVARTKGKHALAAYSRRQAGKGIIAVTLLLAGLLSAPFADPAVMNGWEYISGFSLMLFMVAFPVAVIPVVLNAGRELMHNRS